MAFEPHKPDYYVAGLKVGDEWKGKFHADEDGLYAHLEKDCETDEEGLIVIGMIEALKYYQIWWEDVRAGSEDKSG